MHVKQFILQLEHDRWLIETSLPFTVTFIVKSIYKNLLIRKQTTED